MTPAQRNQLLRDVRAHDARLDALTPEQREAIADRELRALREWRADDARAREQRGDPMRIP